jgi:prepilin-type processing-associated H-X9-DG protein
MSPRSIKLKNHRNETPPAAFTRADFLAMIGILALLALVFRPAFASTRANTRALACLNNMRQLVSAWRMYAEDNQDRLPPNVGSSGKGWVAGWLDWSAGNPDNTNTLFLVNSKLGPYITNPAVYKCPADTYLCVEGGRRMPRVRSVSMNGFVDGSGSGSSWYSGWHYYKKYSDIQAPSPVRLWVFTEEHPDSINDAWLITDVTNPNSWLDLPASYHDGACNFSFADGHGELNKWLDKTTLVPVRQMQYNGFPVSGGRDTAWMIQRSSAPLY